MLVLTEDEKKLLFNFFKDENPLYPEAFVCIKCGYQLLDSNNLLETVNFATAPDHIDRCNRKVNNA